MSSAHDHGHDHDRGLEYDVRTLMSRRRALTLLAGVGATALVGCTTQNATPSSSRQPATTAAAAQCVEIPEETAGPFPATDPTGRTC